MISTRIQPIVLAFLFALAGLGPGPRTVYAQNDSRSGPTPPRLRFIDGAVSFWRTGAEDWSAAQVNTALAAGDSLYAGDGANFEVQIGPRAFVRAASGTEIDLTVARSRLHAVPDHRGTCRPRSDDAAAQPVDRG